VGFGTVGLAHECDLLFYIIYMEARRYDRQ